MKYVILCLAMLCCFAFAGGSHSTAAPPSTPPATGELAGELAAELSLEVEAGETCGSKICGKGTYCCNASCSNCVPYGMACTQQVCAAE